MNRMPQVRQFLIFVIYGINTDLDLTDTRSNENHKKDIKTETNQISESCPVTNEP